MEGEGTFFGFALFILFVVGVVAVGIYAKKGKDGLKSEFDSTKASLEAKIDALKAKLDK